MPGSASRCSISACSATRPSTASNMLSSTVGLLPGLGVALLEAGHATTGVEDLLLAGVEGVALGADVGVDAATRERAAGRELVAAGAGDLGVVVLGVSVLLHGVLSVRSPGRPPRRCGGREPEPVI